MENISWDTREESMTKKSDRADAETWPISSLRNWDKNPRAIKQDKFGELKKRISRFGQFKPLIITPDGEVLGGNMRLRAYQELNIADVWVSVVEPKTEAEKIEIALTDNEEMGYYEDQALAELIAQYKDEIDLTKYSVHLGQPQTLAEILQQFSPDEVVEDEAPEVAEETESEVGQVYQLGRHRVMCGDSTKIEDVEKLMDGKKADMVFTDPPYGMNLDTDYSGIKGTSRSIGASRNILGKKYDKVIGDDKEYDPSVLLKIFSEVKEIFMWGGDYYSKLLPAGGWFVWDKCVTEGGIVSEGAEKMIGSTFELCWSKAKHKRMIVRIFQRGFAGGDSEKVHPTQKPIKLSTWFIDKFSEKEQIVADLFLGSGSTLIACEQTNRTCYGMELDPKYVDIIRKRYAKFIDPENWEDNWQSMTPETGK